MILGIEIGGTKLQLGVAQRGGGELLEIERREVDRSLGAQGILQEIESSAADLQRRFDIQRIGVGFGGPLDARQGRVIKSHQVSGWDGFPLSEWLQQATGLPAVIGNDCDVAALAEDRYGAGRDGRSTFYVTVGTGIGGGFVVDGQLLGQDRPAVAEIGHLRPGLAADIPGATVESLAAGPALADAAEKRISGALAGGSAADVAAIEDLRSRRVDPDHPLTGQIVGEAAAAGNPIAGEVVGQACQALGWAIAQAITLLAPETVVVGGGVSLLGDALFFDPLRAAVARYVFPPLASTFEIRPAGLGELVVVRGAIAIAE